MNGALNDPRILRGMEAQLKHRRARLNAGEKPIGWKVGFGSPPALARLGLDAPLIGFLIFTAGPMIVSLGLSLTDYDVLRPPRFIGLQNYQTMLTDARVGLSLGNTFFYAFLHVPLAIAVALGLAMLLAIVNNFGGGDTVLCWITPMAWQRLTRAQVLAAGAQVLMVSESCGGDASWQALVHRKRSREDDPLINVQQGTQSDFTGFTYESGCALPDDAEFIRAHRGTRWTRIWEDATMVTRVAESYRKIRNTCRFLLGNLHDFDPRRHAVRLEDLEEIDRLAKIVF